MAKHKDSDIPSNLSSTDVSSRLVNMVSSNILTRTRAIATSDLTPDAVQANIALKHVEWLSKSLDIPEELLIRELNSVMFSEIIRAYVRHPSKLGQSLSTNHLNQDSDQTYSLLKPFLSQEKVYLIGVPYRNINGGVCVKLTLHFETISSPHIDLGFDNHFYSTLLLTGKP